MQKLFFFFAVSFSFAYSIEAQETYVRAGLGYAFPQAGQSMDGTSTPYSGSMTNSSTTASNNQITYNIKKASYAAGLHAFLAGGYMFNKNVGLDVSLDIGVAPKKYALADNNISVPIGGGSTLNENLLIKQYVKTPVLFTPALLMQTGGKILNLYTRTGLVIPLHTKVIQDQIFQNVPGTGATETDDYTFEIKNTFTLGISAAIGMQYRLSDKMLLWGEMNGLSMSLFTKQGTLTKFTVNGVNYTSAVPDSNKYVYYSQNFQGQQSDYYHQPAYAQPFSNIGIAIGMKYIFSGRISTSKHRQLGKNYDDNDNF